MKNNKKLRSIKVKYLRKNQAPRIPYKFYFNVSQFTMVDEVQEILADKMKVDVSKTVLFRLCIENHLAKLKAILTDSKSTENDFKAILQQLEAATKDR